MQSFGNAYYLLKIRILPVHYGILWMNSFKAEGRIMMFVLLCSTSSLIKGRIHILNLCATVMSPYLFAYTDHFDYFYEGPLILISWFCMWECTVFDLGCVKLENKYFKSFSDRWKNMFLTNLTIATTAYPPYYQTFAHFKIDQWMLCTFGLLNTEFYKKKIYIQYLQNIQ